MALICAAPLAWAVRHPGIRLHDLLDHVGAPGTLMIGGSGATIAVAVYALAAQPPPIPIDRLPPARMT